MALKDLLAASSSKRKIGLSEERISAIIPEVRKYISFWREYPDLFVDFLQNGGDETIPKRLNLFSYQKVFMRAVARHKYVYAVFPREYCARGYGNIVQESV